jgi:hypothetical protein
MITASRVHSGKPQASVISRTTMHSVRSGPRSCRAAPAGYLSLVCRPPSGTGHALTAREGLAYVDSARVIHRVAKSRGRPGGVSDAFDGRSCRRRERDLLIRRPWWAVPGRLSRGRDTHHDIGWRLDRMAAHDKLSGTATRQGSGSRSRDVHWARFGRRSAARRSGSMP